MNKIAKGSHINNEENVNIIADPHERNMNSL